MDQTIRNKLRGVVTQCRKLLEDSTAQALQGRFGIYPSRKKGEVQIEDEARMAHLTKEDRACRQDLLDHLEHIQAIGYKPSEALEQLVREISFTHLNRLCAYKMMESRGLIREAVSRGLKSQGFFFYLADHPEDEKLHNGGGQETAYRNFLDWLGGTLSQEIGVLFNPNDPANRIYPPQRVLDEVLALINDGDLKDIWSQDETIGWVYQYFTPKELRDNARKESQAPRNSYELAFRNQFFTPRYVVEFLTDNTLGRIWYEMRKGKTILKDRCKYLVRRPTEMFLKEGETPPAESKDVRENLSQEELLKQPVYIPHRPKKDPRELKVLDPACGSGHFLLYCFDLLQVIYEEAYDDPDLGAALRKDYPAIEDLRRAVPALILKHNLHGIDIDLRATQIAALALWLRCQRAYQELGLKNGERPKITRSNIVCAEPMPGETDLLKEFTGSLKPKVLGQLVETVFEKMKLAGEAGSLLKIEEEIRDAALTAKKEYQEELRQQKKQSGYLPGMAPPRERTLFDFSDMTDSEFLDRVEDEIVAALRQYAETASNGRGFRRRLFAEDAARGFSFVDVCSKRYDVVLMNPPYGTPSEPSKPYLSLRYPTSWIEIYICFCERAMVLSPNGLVGSLTSRTWMYLQKYAHFRKNILVHQSLRFLADLGGGVLDNAVVETCAHILGGNSGGETACCFFDLNSFEEKGLALNLAIMDLAKANLCPPAYIRNQTNFLSSDNYSISYTSQSSLQPVTLIEVGSNLFSATPGLSTHDDFRFARVRWEVPEKDIKGERWMPAVYGGQSHHFCADHYMLLNWHRNGAEMKDFVASIYGSASRGIRNESCYFKPGLTYQYTGSTFRVHILPKGMIITMAGQGLFPKQFEDSFALLALLNTSSATKALKLINPGRFFQSGYVNALQLSGRWKEHKSSLNQIGIRLFRLIRELCNYDETSNEYSLSNLHFLNSSIDDHLLSLRQEIEKYGQKLEDIAASLFPSLTVAALEKDDRWHFQDTGLYELRQSVFHILIGIVYGRWDIRFATGERQPPELLDPFDPLPVCPPGMLQGPDGLPAKPEDVPTDYPIRIDWDGILVDDPGHEDDIIRRVQDVLEVIWKDRAEAIELEACEILGVRELRDYFRKPGNGGFWMDHVKRYSKSRRKAPIYWYLRSAKGNYGLWLYYHRLDKDILFKALLNYVEPKIRLEEDRLRALRSRKEAVGSAGREAKQLEKDIDRQEQFVSELRDFEEKLRRVANLHLDFDLNDGVILNMAPLWELVPWNEPKKYWEELQEGKYDWAHIALQLWPERVKEKCRTDRSLAIAHGLEKLCAVQQADTGKRTRRRK